MGLVTLSAFGGSTGIPDKKLVHFNFPKLFFPKDQSNLAFHPGPVLQPSVNGARIVLTIKVLSFVFTKTLHFSPNRTNHAIQSYVLYAQCLQQAVRTILSHILNV